MVASAQMFSSEQEWRLNCLPLVDDGCGWEKLCGGLDGKIYVSPYSISDG